MKQILINMSMLLIMVILVVLMMLISVAFLTLMERKVLSYIQMRKGPNKVGFKGVLQPFSDAIKLLSKEIYFMNKVNNLYYYYTPMFMLILISLMWLIYPLKGGALSMEFSVIYLMCCFSLSGYGLLMSGWSSNSTYSMMGSIRSLSQAISYEVNLSLIMLIVVTMFGSYNLMIFKNFQGMGWVLMSHLMSVSFLISLMAELNRTPFDFSEGESELVSGFNVEYMSGGFVLIFLSEYASILFLSFLYISFFLGSDWINLMFYLMMMMLTFIIIWLRGTTPRFRYDLLMYLCWMVILPFVLNFFLLMFIYKLLIYS
uniref:NADH-ubiquinone oxidoreductase chain 1 n=1 Tax=Hypsicera sp. ZJUH_2016019 TaxID=2491161 RepID=A0A3S8V0V6_9HYME|nr:NADH dehydrogenase subunit 1 [Hypsicera sp. ZJUH_2016019]